MITLGISTWSLNRQLSAGKLSVLDVPAEVRRHGLTDLQVCHFHLKSRDAGHLRDMRYKLAASNVTLDALLLDFGDVASPETGPADELALRGWLESAAALGARHARISAGKQPPDDESLQRSADALIRLSDRGRELGVKVITENWQELLPSSAEVLRLLELTQGKVPLCLDFGNWEGDDKYDELEKIAPDAVSVHAKCSFGGAGGLVADEPDFTRCLKILEDSDYEGSLALIYDGPSPEEWRHLDQMREMVRKVFPA